MNDETNFFSEIDDMKAELEGYRNPRRQRRNRSSTPESNPSDQPTEFDSMLNELEDLKQSEDLPNDVSFDLTIKQNGSGRGDHADRDNYKGLSFGSLYDVITKKYR